MEITVERVLDAVKRAKNEIQLAGIETEFVDAVASALAVLDLTGLRDASMPTGRESDPIISLPETFAEWADNYNITKHYERILAAMVYLFERGITSVTTTDVYAMYDKARWKKPANAADILAKGARRKLFTEAEDSTENEDGAKLWRITQTGYRYFESLRYEILEE